MLQDLTQIQESCQILSIPQNRTQQNPTQRSLVSWQPDLPGVPSSSNRQSRRSHPIPEDFASITPRPRPPKSSTTRQPHSGCFFLTSLTPTWPSNVFLQDLVSSLNDALRKRYPWTRLELNLTATFSSPLAKESPFPDHDRRGPPSEPDHRCRYGQLHHNDAFDHHKR